VGLRAGLDRWKNLAPTWIRSPDRPARRQSLYGLRYQAYISDYCKVVNNFLYGPDHVYRAPGGLVFYNF
jgi:hypothetical protein